RVSHFLVRRGLAWRTRFSQAGRARGTHEYDSTGAWVAVSHAVGRNKNIRTVRAVRAGFAQKVPETWCVSAPCRPSAAVPLTRGTLKPARINERILPPRGGNNILDSGKALQWRM